MTWDYTARDVNKDAVTALKILPVTKSMDHVLKAVAPDMTSTVIIPAKLVWASADIRFVLLFCQNICKKMATLFFTNIFLSVLSCLYYRLRRKYECSDRRILRVIIIRIFIF